MEQEIWKDIIGYEGLYQISNLGRVKSLDRYILNKGNKGDNKTSKLKGRILKDRISRTRHGTSGYRIVSLHKNGVSSQFRISRIVYETFIDEIDENLVIDHINNIKTDDRLENLQMLSQRQNISKDRGNKKHCKLIGAYKCSKTDKFYSQININGKIIYLGRYDDEISASEAYKKYLEII